MGLLDDAIREHLDLKRRRGGDPAEIERAEREALGPVRRGPEEEPPSFHDDLHEEAREVYAREDELTTHAHSDEPGIAEPAPSAYEAEAPLREEHAYEDEEAYEIEPAAHSPEPLAPEPRAPESRSVYERPASEPASYDEPPLPEPTRPYEEPPPPAPSRTPPPLEFSRAPEPPRRPEPPEHLTGETVEYDVESAFDEGEEGDDVLEETPEFLQDTPDHDRLWFEQRPPRDFDFDG